MGARLLPPLILDGGRPESITMLDVQRKECLELIQKRHCFSHVEPLAREFGNPLALPRDLVLALSDVFFGLDQMPLDRRSVHAPE